MPEYDMNRPGAFHWRAVLLCLLLGANLPARAQVQVQVQWDDAQRFARLLKQTAYRPSVQEIERDVVVPASPGLEDLLAREDIAAERLQAGVEAQRYAYRHAVELCLPALERISGRVGPWLRELDEVLGTGSDAQVVAVFGAATTGGMVQGERIIIALEVQCRFADSPAMAERVLEAAIRHEAVHLHQLPRQQTGARNSLLRQALIEGFADWISTRQMGEPAPQARERAAFGAANEAQLWQAFQLEMDGISLGQWMYGPGREGQPADLGYWIGSRIIDAYMARTDLESAPMQTLLLLESPQAILEASAYDPGRER